ncbi:MAG: hypothetical protein AB1758_30465, partial [Candidatus Eremiobacterota bacterium]
NVCSGEPFHFAWRHSRQGMLRDRIPPVPADPPDRQPWVLAATLALVLALGALSRRIRPRRSL